MNYKYNTKGGIITVQVKTKEELERAIKKLTTTYKGNK